MDKADRYYILPFLVYVLAAPLVQWPGGNPFLAYALKILATGAVLLAFRHQYAELKGIYRPSRWAVYAGLAIAGSWVLIDPYYPKLGPVGSFDPSPLPQPWFALVLAIRLLGSTFVAAFVEELFVRSFVLRFVIDPNHWRDIPPGQFTWPSFVVTVAFFALAHDRWLAAMITGIILNLLLYRTRDLRDCILAHGFANLALGIFVMVARRWEFW